MDRAVSNTSPLLYLHRIGSLSWLRELFAEIWVPQAVVDELLEGARRGHDVPRTADLEWIEVVKPSSVPSEWLALDLGSGELEAMTLRILLEAKAKGLTDSISPLLDGLEAAGMWISQDIRDRILILAGERPY